MTVRSLEDDWGTGVDDSGGQAKVLTRRWLDINWAFPANYNTAIEGFEIVAFVGTDPSDASSWIFQPRMALPTERRMVVCITPTGDLVNVNAAVRAIYV